jgi:hypothetical protein
MKFLRQFFFFVLLPIKLISCSSGYKKIDNKWAYITYDEGNWGDKHMMNVDHQTFKLLDDKRYGKDHSKVFFEGQLIENADSKTFRIIKNDYSSDNYQVYLKTYVIINADPKSFKLLKFPYARDNKHVYCGTIPMEVNDMEHFRVTEGSSSIGIQPSEVFIKENPGYSYIDTLKYKYIIYGFGLAETPTEKFTGYKKINIHEK